MTKSSPYRHLAHLPSLLDQPIVFFTCATFDRRRILNHLAVRDILHGIWARSGERNGWFVGFYVLMPEHVHFFARQAVESDTMAKWVEMWKSVSARRIAAILEISPPIWQEEYFDRFLRSSDSYSDKWNYVRENPVRAGLAQKADDWPYQGRIWDLTV